MLVCQMREKYIYEVLRVGLNPWLCSKRRFGCLLVFQPVFRMELGIILRSGDVQQGVALVPFAIPVPRTLLRDAVPLLVMFAIVRCGGNAMEYGTRLR